MTKNAADELQVKKAGEREKRKSEQDVLDIGNLLNLPEGKRFFKHLFEVCGVSSSVWHASALIHYRSGAQDVGHYFVKRILEANPSVGSALLADTYKEQKGPEQE